MGTNGTNDRDTAADANVEPDTSDGTVAAEKAAGDAPLCRVHIHHIRQRLADLDNLSGKAVLDGIVQAGLLTDDSAQFVKEIRVSQAKGKPEKTIVTLSWEEPC